MPRVPRLPFPIASLLSALSLLIFALSLILWTRGYFAWERIVMTTTYAASIEPPAGSGFIDYSITNSHGSIAFSRFHIEVPTNSYAPGLLWNYLRESPRALRPRRRPGDRINFHFAGFALLHRSSANSISRNTIQEVVLPLWLFLPSAIPPAMWLRRYHRQHARGFPITPATTPAAPN